uniref:Uncharacterized protein n=1 Tax=Trypanosoma congolense (strain IL3000) TaxID=1068625 RepID=G0UQZ4_TRYCI|nr:hypothetical protein, unlikely [Trypanosoma congolense IL3000]
MGGVMCFCYDYFYCVDSNKRSLMVCDHCYCDVSLVYGLGGKHGGTGGGLCLRTYVDGSHSQYPSTGSWAVRFLNFLPNSFYLCCFFSLLVGFHYYYLFVIIRTAHHFLFHWRKRLLTE